MSRTFEVINHELHVTITSLSEEEGEISFSMVIDQASPENFVSIDIKKFIKSMIPRSSSPSLLSWSLSKGEPWIYVLNIDQLREFGASHLTFTKFCLQKCFLQQMVNWLILTLNLIIQPSTKGQFKMKDQSWLKQSKFGKAPPPNTMNLSSTGSDNQNLCK